MNLSDEGEEVVGIYRRHLRIDIKRYLKRKFGKPLHLIPSEAFECVRIMPSDNDEHLYSTRILHLYQPLYIMKNIRTILIKDGNLIKQ